ADVPPYVDRWGAASRFRPPPRKIVANACIEGPIATAEARLQTRPSRERRSPPRAAPARHARLLAAARCCPAATASALPCICRGMPRRRPRCARPRLLATSATARTGIPASKGNEVTRHMLQGSVAEKSRRENSLLQSRGSDRRNAAAVANIPHAL